MRQESATTSPRTPKRARIGNAAPATSLPKDAGLFEELRKLRLELAQEAGVPPFVIFHDTVLRELARMRPTTRTELDGISGVGKVKMQRYGDDFLEVIRSFADR